MNTNNKRAVANRLSQMEFFHLCKWVVDNKEIVVLSHSYQSVAERVNSDPNIRISKKVGADHVKNAMAVTEIEFLKYEKDETKLDVIAAVLADVCLRMGCEVPAKLQSIIDGKFKA